MTTRGWAKLAVRVFLLVVATLGAMALGARQARAWEAPTLDGKLDPVYRQRGAITRYSDGATHVLTGESDMSAATLYVLEDDTHVYIYYHQDLYSENDNSYGDNSIHWATLKHNGKWHDRERGFGEIVESDKGEFTFIDRAGGVAAHFYVDQLSSESGTPSGYSCLGFSGSSEDSQWLDGYVSEEDRDLIEVTSAMAYNLNETGYCDGGVCGCGGVDLLSDSPEAYGTYQVVDEDCGDWQWQNGWEMKLDKEIFHELGFGVVIGDHHNSPTKACHTHAHCAPLLEVAQGSIGDQIWYDVNRDGLQQSGEPGLGGVRVELIDPRDGRVIESQLTGGGGDYVFEMLSNEYYIVRVDESTLPSGFSSTNYEVGDFKEGYVNDRSYGDHPCDVDHGCLQRDGATYERIFYIDLDYGQDYGAADFGYVPGDATKAVIGDYVWSDASHDGVQDPGEPGIGGVALELLADDDGDGTFDDVVDSTTTGDGGAYRFINVDPGTYKVGVADSSFDAGAALDGYTVTSGPHSPGADVTAPIDVGTGDVYLGADFGYYQDDLGSIGNVVWYDADQDGEQDAGEEGAEGVTVDLYLDKAPKAELDGNDSLIATAVTTSTGGYLFRGLELGEDYLVTVSDRDGVLTGFDVTTYWGDDDEAICTLDASLPDDHPTCDPLDLDRYNAPVPVHLTASLPDWPWADFGYSGDGVIGDVVWYDADQDGVQGGGEIGVPGVELQLYYANGQPYDRKTSGPGSSGTQPYILSTGSAGAYHFRGLPAGDYEVGMTLPPGYSLSPGTPDNPHDNDGEDDDGINLEASERYPDADFGLYRADAYTIGDTVWYDGNGDGTRDDGESGIANVTLALYEDSDGDGVLDATEPLLGEVTTGADGEYTFYGAVDGEDYLVRVTDKHGVLTDYDLTAGMTPWALTIEGASRDDIDFGYVGDRETAIVGDTVWYDADGDGVEDATESGIANVVVELYQDDGDGSFGGGDSLVGTAYTDADGRYLFGDLPAGSYFAHVGAGSFDAGEPLEGLSSTTGGETTGTIVLSEGETYLDADFGYRGSGYAVGDYVWSDADEDGIQDAGEPGLGDVAVELLGGGGQVVETATTQPDGFYAFSGLAAGSYRVRIADSNFGAGATLDGLSVTSGPQSEGDETSRKVMFVDDGDPSNDSVMNLDFGYHGYVLGSIGDYVWLDMNQDGNQDAGEPGMGNVSLDLVRDLDGDGVYDAGEPAVASTRTDSDGIYQFAGLELDDGDGDADYLVRVTDRENVLGLMSVTPGTVNPHAVTLSDGHPSYQDADFGYDDPDLGDLVWHDTDHDGMQDAGESGIGGVEVLLYHDATQNGALDAGQDELIRSTTTSADGYYFFTGLDFDDYIIKLADSNFGSGGVLEGFSRSPRDAGDDTLDSDGDENHQIAVTPMTAKDFTFDFGFYGGPHTIGDYVWEDADGDGIQDGGEVGIDGVTLTLYRDLDEDGVLDGGDAVLGRTTTSGGGSYAFPDLPNGTYIVDVTDRNGVLVGYSQTSGGDTSGLDPVGLTVAGSDRLDLDFGYDGGASVGDYVWEDGDKNNVQSSSSDRGFEGVTVRLYDDSGTLIGETESDAGGYYEFTGLTPGDYYLVFVNPDPSEWAFVVKDEGGDEDLDSDADATTGQTAAFSLSAGERASRWDAGFGGGSGATAVTLSSFAAGAGSGPCLQHVPACIVAAGVLAAIGWMGWSRGLRRRVGQGWATPWG
jgi:hypothetical protein